MYRHFYNDRIFVDAAVTGILVNSDDREFAIDLCCVPLERSSKVVLIKLGNSEQVARKKAFCFIVFNRISICQHIYFLELQLSISKF